SRRRRQAFQRPWRHGPAHHAWVCEGGARAEDDRLANGDSRLMRPSRHFSATCGRWSGRIPRFPRVCLALGLLTVLAACAVSEREELEIGSSEAASIDSQVPIVDDSSITQFVATLG